MDAHSWTAIPDEKYRSPWSKKGKIAGEVDSRVPTKTEPPPGSGIAIRGEDHGIEALGDIDMPEDDLEESTGDAPIAAYATAP